MEWNRSIITITLLTYFSETSNWTMSKYTFIHVAWFEGQWPPICTLKMKHPDIIKLCLIKFISVFCSEVAICVVVAGIVGSGYILVCAMLEIVILV